MKLTTRKQEKYYLKWHLGNVNFPIQKNVNAYLQSHPVLVMMDTELKTMK